MTEALQKQIEDTRRAIETLEAQRGALGDQVTNNAQAALKKELALLEDQAAAQAAPAEERRLVTILFTDMVGSTSAAEKLDPEDWRGLIGRLHETLGGAITAHRGEVAQYLGDGILAFFGAKQASESDAENAIRAALAAQAAVTELLAAERVQVRVGVHTGLVVVGELGDASHKEFTASGDAMNLAARLQSAAPPGGILISHDTYRYVRGVFDFTPRPPLTVKGKSEPIQTYLVRRAKPRPFRTVARGVAGVEASTVGREAEMQVLQAAYLRAYEGHGIAWAQLVGGPGLGKTRLVSEMDDWTDLRQETYRLLRARAFADDGSQPFALIRRMWFDRFEIPEGISLPQAEAAWVEGFKEFFGRSDAEEAAHALGLLVGLPFEGSPHIGAMRNDPGQVKGRAFVVSRELLRTVRQQSPVVVLLEDLQWADDASWDYLREVFLGGEADAQPEGMFILAAARPEWTPPVELTELFKATATGNNPPAKWGTQIELALLTDDAMRMLARQLLEQAADIPEDVIELLVTRSEGVPYFAEEMVNWLIDHDILNTREEPWRFKPEKLKEQPLPATLQHLLLTRLSGLSQTERMTLQRGAIFGRRFWTGGLEALGIDSGAAVLGHLQPRGFVQAQAESAFQDDTEWSFNQSLLQEVTYESVLKRERAALHKVAASWLEQQARQAGRLDEFAGLLGDHNERAGELSAAADWHRRAGEHAMRLGAPRQAQAFYTQALNLLPPVDRERRWSVLLGRQKALVILADVDAAQEDIATLVELAAEMEDDHRLAEAYAVQAEFFRLKGDDRMTDQAARQALEAAARCGDENTEIKARALIVQANVETADPAVTVSSMEEALRRARLLGDETLLQEVLYRAAYCLGFAGGGGRQSQAILLQQEQIDLAHKLGDRASEAVGLTNLGAGYLFLGLYKQARSPLERSLVIDEALGARRGIAYACINLSDVYFNTGDLRRARQWCERALQEINQTQDARATSNFLVALGLTLLKMGDGAAAERRFKEAFELSSSKGLQSSMCETRVALAAAAVMQGELEEARQYAEQAWDYLRDHPWQALQNSGQGYADLAEAFDALGDSERRDAVVERAHQGLMKDADGIDLPEWRHSFLQNVPYHRTLMEMWERRKPA
jgi:class 3 adenylate cyclase/tetratricopeptide (TPR) repeat protein